MLSLTADRYPSNCPSASNLAADTTVNGRLYPQSMVKNFCNCRRRFISFVPSTGRSQHKAQLESGMWKLLRVTLANHGGQLTFAIWISAYDCPVTNLNFIYPYLQFFHTVDVQLRRLNSVCFSAGFFTFLRFFWDRTKYLRGHTHAAKKHLWIRFTVVTLCLAFPRARPFCPFSAPNCDFGKVNVQHTLLLDQNVDGTPLTIVQV